jgi:hypothetical protein
MHKIPSFFLLVLANIFSLSVLLNAFEDAPIRWYKLLTALLGWLCFFILLLAFSKRVLQNKK